MRYAAEPFTDDQVSCASYDQARVAEHNKAVIAVSSSWRVGRDSRLTVYAEHQETCRAFRCYTRITRQAGCWLSVHPPSIDRPIFDVHPISRRSGSTRAASEYFLASVVISRFFTVPLRSWERVAGATSSAISSAGCRLVRMLRHRACGRSGWVSFLAGRAPRTPGA